MIAAAIFLCIGLLLAGLVYAAASVYYRYKENRFWASMEKMLAEPPTEEEQAIGDEWESEDDEDDDPVCLIPPDLEVEFKDPEDDEPTVEKKPASASRLEEAVKAAEAMKQLAMKQVGAALIVTPADPYETPTGTIRGTTKDELDVALAAVLSNKEAQEKAEDEAFYQETVEEAKKGPVPLTPPAPQPPPSKEELDAMLIDIGGQMIDMFEEDLERVDEKIRYYQAEREELEERIKVIKKNSASMKRKASQAKKPKRKKSSKRARR